MINPFKQTGRRLVIGDLHEPFTLKNYLPFCQSIYKKYNCNKVIFIGDILDQHFTSFHDVDPDGHSAGRELELAVKNISNWYKAFPFADVCLGNHDLIPNRKAFASGISKSWIKPISEVLNTPNWNYASSFTYDDVFYTHGTGRKARQRMKQDLASVVQGHYHSDSYIEFIAGKRYRLFALQVGCGVDRKAYAMAYGAEFAKPQINCGVILSGGRLPIIEYMDL